MKQTLAPRKVTPAPRERGAALIISLILLVLITLISVASLRNVVLEEKMVSNFYDRSLAYLHRRKNWHKPTLLGLAHECQRVEELALASWDVPLQGTVTDKAWY